MRSLFLRGPVDKRTFHARALSRHDGIEALIKPCLRLRRDSTQGRAARGCERSIPQIVNRLTALRQLGRLDQILSGIIHRLNSFLRAIANSKHCRGQSHRRRSLGIVGRGHNLFTCFRRREPLSQSPQNALCNTGPRSAPRRDCRPASSPSVRKSAVRNSRHPPWFADSTADWWAPERAYLLS